MKYRREIDGLRAVAVLPVILFHAGFTPFGGGFVGVDIFFVISGYLITSIILGELESDSFSVLGFYERRARRILPALFLVMLTCLPFAWLWLPPADLRSFSHSLIAVPTFSSNILFWQESGYFDAATELKPLIHTWSLAVEEQFYLLLPPLLMLAWRYGKNAAITLFAALSIASLVFAQWSATHSPSAAFFLLPSRGWELAIGSLIAACSNDDKRITLPPAARQTLAIAGLVLIAYSIVAYDKTTPFPSLYTLAPTLGAALVIVFAKPETFAGRILGSRILVGPGLISYSAYLWHQPIFAFARLREISAPSPVAFLGLSLLSLLLACLSWHYIERPFRRRLSIPRSHLLSLALAGSSAFIVLGTLGPSLQENFLNGEKAAYLHVKGSYWQALRAAEDINPRRAECLSSPSNPISLDSSCTLGDEKRIIGALVGDSHADTIAYPIEKALAHSSLGIRNLTYLGCPPVAGLHRIGQPGYRCDEHYTRVYDYLRSNSNIRYVIIMSRWTLYAESERFNNQEGGIEEGAPVIFDALEVGQLSKRTQEERRQLILEKYKETIAALLKEGKTVFLVYPIPEVGINVPRTIANKLRSEPEASYALTTSFAAFEDRNRRTIAALDSIVENQALYRVRPDRMLCNSLLKDRCITQLNGEIFYYDDDHPSNSGGDLIVQGIIEKILKDGPRQTTSGIPDASPAPASLAASVSPKSLP